MILAAGHRADYRQLQRFHYIAGPPATWAQIWTIHHHWSDTLAGGSRSSPVAIAVLSYPCLNCAARDRALNLSRMNPKRRQSFINQNLRTISRLIVHPTYRGLGLASILIHCILNNCPTRYTEALATMAKAHPLFKKSAMKEFPPDHDTKPHYFLFKKNSSVSSVFSVAEPNAASAPSKSSCRAAGRK